MRYFFLGDSHIEYKLAACRPVRPSIEETPTLTRYTACVDVVRYDSCLCQIINKHEKTT